MARSQLEVVEVARGRSSLWLLGVLNPLKMENVITDPTRITEKSSTTIDLIVSSDKSKVKTSGVYDTSISDHHLVYAVINLFRRETKPKLREIKDYKNLDVNALKLGFERAPWHVAEVFEDIDDIAWTWEYLYGSIMDEHLKRKKLKVRDKSLPWMNTAIRKQMNLRYKLLKKAQKSPNDTDKWVQYKKQRNYVIRIFGKLKLTTGSISLKMLTVVESSGK